MELAGMLLALIVTISVVGQLLLILWGNHFRNFDNRQWAEARARLIEDAFDRQIASEEAHKSVTLDRTKGVPDADH